MMMKNRSYRSGAVIPIFKRYMGKNILTVRRHFGEDTHNQKVIICHSQKRKDEKVNLNKSTDTMR